MGVSGVAVMWASRGSSLTKRRHPPYSTEKKRRRPPIYPEDGSILTPPPFDQRILPQDAFPIPEASAGPEPGDGARDHPRLLPDGRARRLGRDHRAARHPRRSGL